METSLREMRVGQQGRVVSISKQAPAYRQKLLAMGLTPGTVFSITRHAPLGDPVEIRVRGFALSLRKGEADALRVEVI